MKQLALILLLLHTLFTSPSECEPGEIGKLYDLCLATEPKALYTTLLSKTFSDDRTLRATTILFEAHPHQKKVASIIKSLKQRALIDLDKNMHEQTIP
jgi:hypothetical protein